MRKSYRLSFWTMLLAIVIPLSLVFGQYPKSPTYFSSVPPSKALIGVKLEYQAKVQSMTMRMTPVMDTFVFRLTRAPEGMTIDSVKGLVTWIPSAFGSYPVEIVATNQWNDRAVQDFKISVVNFIGTVSGSVKNDTGVAVPFARVTLYSTSKNPTALCQVFSAGTDSLGKYAISNLDSGSYFAVASSMRTWVALLLLPMRTDYADVWYVNSPTISGATPIAVSSASPVSVNFAMHKRVNPVPALVSGTVTDTAGKPIAGATVVILSAEKNPIIIPNTPMCDPKNFYFQDPSFGYFPQTVFRVKTNADGKYALTSYVGGPYLVTSFASGFALQYYNGKNNAAEADKLTLTGDLAGINFSLAALPKAVAALSGKVVDTAGAGVPSRIVLLPIALIRTATTWPQLKPRSMHTDSLGNFVLNSVANGMYFLQAFPFKGYFPAYYKVNAVNKADTIIVNNADIAGLNVTVRKVTAGGAGTISGRVLQPNGQGVAGVVVSAISADKNIQNFALTGTDGNYLIDELDPASYTVAAEKNGYISGTPSAATIAYQTGFFTAQTSLQMAVQSPSAVETQNIAAVSSYQLGQNFPNPFNPTTTISFEIPEAAHVNIVVFDDLGRTVQTLVNDRREAGRYDVHFDAGTLSSGVYFYKLTAGSYSTIKNMLLLK